MASEYTLPGSGRADSIWIDSIVIAHIYNEFDTLWPECGSLGILDCYIEFYCNVVFCLSRLCPSPLVRLQIDFTVYSASKTPHPFKRLVLKNPACERALIDFHKSIPAGKYAGPTTRSQNAIRPFA